MENYDISTPESQTQCSAFELHFDKILSILNWSPWKVLPLLPPLSKKGRLLLTIHGVKIGGEYRNPTDQAKILQGFSGCAAHSPINFLFLTILRGSNPGLVINQLQPCAYPSIVSIVRNKKLVGTSGIEPLYLLCKSNILPLN